MMNTETACLENCLCNETCQSSGQSKAGGSLVSGAMNAGPRKALPKVFLPGPASQITYLATRIQALHSNRQEIISSQCNPCSCPSPPSKHDCGREVSLTCNSSFLVVVILTTIFFPLLKLPCCLSRLNNVQLVWFS